MADQSHIDPQVDPGQDQLFDGNFSPLPEDAGFRGPAASAAAGITYRQLDYWARTKLVVPEIRAAQGSGSQRLYSFRDVLLLRVIKNLLEAGVSLPQIRVAIDEIRARGTDVTAATIVSDGVSVYQVTSAHEMFDLCRGGQGMFMISLGGVWREIESTLLELPAEQAQPSATEGTEASSVATDELARRRAARAAG